MVPKIKKDWAGWGWNAVVMVDDVKKMWVKCADLRVGDVIWGANSRPEFGSMGRWEGWAVTNGDPNDYNSLMYLRQSRGNMWFYITERTVENENEFGPVSP